jgi:quercetin dioxygenase-like cupin family protein
MLTTSPIRRIRNGSVLAAIASVAIASGAALAGECPAGKAGVNVTPPGAMAPKGVTDTVISSINLAKFMDGQFGNNSLRMRRLVIAPGGIVPWHNHDERPANIYVVEGSITEYRSTCAVPIEHKAGEAVAEFGSGLAHWWRNNTNKPAVLISADVYHDKMKDDHPM